MEKSSPRIPSMGLLMRVFSAKKELVLEQVKRAIEAVRYASYIHSYGRNVFSRVDILIPSDERFHDSDCGATASALRDFVKQTFIRLSFDIQIHEVRRGDIFCSVLNYGVAHHLRCGIEYSVVLSPQVADYLNYETMDAMLRAIEEGAKVVGVALDELSEGILKGRIANTFAVWNNLALMTVGGFDLRARKPRKDEKLVPYLRGWSKEKEEKDGNGEVYYHQAGVEEIPPLIRLVELFGPCIAPILSQGANAKRWVAPDPVKDPEGYARHLKKMGTKTERQAAHAAALGADLSYLEGGVMPKYRQK